MEHIYLSDVSEINTSSEQILSHEALDKFDRLMEDDKFTDGTKYGEAIHELTAEEREDKFNELVNGNINETDDAGKVYRRDGIILPNTEYVVNGNTYRTDDRGRKIVTDAVPVYSEEGSRNMKEQRESGGFERKEDDDGGHIIARILGGAEGEENLVPMRRTINRGDYKKMENEISKALQDGKVVTEHIEIAYEGESQRPSKIQSTYKIDGRQYLMEFDNDECSIDLLDSLKDKVREEDLNSLTEEISDMKADGIEVSITSVKTEYDDKDSPTKIIVGMLDESNGEKTYMVYEPR